MKKIATLAATSALFLISVATPSQAVTPLTGANALIGQVAVVYGAVTESANAAGSPKTYELAIDGVTYHAYVQNGKAYKVVPSVTANQKTSVVGAIVVKYGSVVASANAAGSPKTYQLKIGGKTYRAYVQNGSVYKIG